MDTTTPAVSPLRQRMLEDMRMRKLELKTLEAYIRAVRKPTANLKRSPDIATVEELLRLHQAGKLQFFGEHAALANAKAFKAWLASLRRCEWVVSMPSGRSPGRRRRWPTGRATRTGWPPPTAACSRWTSAA